MDVNALFSCLKEGDSKTVSSTRPKGAPPELAPPSSYTTFRHISFRRPLDRILIIIAVTLLALSIGGCIEGRERLTEERIVLPGVEAPASGK
jgi:hypothetical protein